MTISKNKPENKPENNPEDTLLKFPCMFPIKVMGLNKPELKKYIQTVLNKHISKTNIKAIEFNEHVSQHKNYLSITAKFEAKSKKQLDAIYQDLGKKCGKEDSKIIKMIL